MDFGTVISLVVFFFAGLSGRLMMTNDALNTDREQVGVLVAIITIVSILLLARGTAVWWYLGLSLFGFLVGATALNFLRHIWKKSQPKVQKTVGDWEPSEEDDKHLGI
jgi:hypothetical protein